MNTPKPIAATSQEWDQWQNTVKAKNPIWYFFHETLPFELSCYKRILANARHWVRHRTYDKYHIVPVYGMKPGYADTDRRMLYANFGLLVDFIEIEKAHMHNWCNLSKRSKLQACKDFVKHTLFFAKDERNVEDGLAHLDWEIGLVYDETYGISPDEENYGKPTSQALSAKEQKEIYLWFKNVHLTRPDEHEASGWFEICRRKEAGEIVPESDIRAALDLSQSIETTYNQEDEDMLKRLMGIRLSLWT